MGKTKTVGNDFSSMVEDCLACREKTSLTTKTVHLPIEFKMHQENEKPTDTKETETYFEHDTKESDGMTMDDSVFGNWGIPTGVIEQEARSSMLMGQRKKKTSDAEIGGLQPETSSVLSEFQLGKRKLSSDFVHVKQELSNGDVWLGPQLGYKGKKASDSELSSQEPASGGMWFGLWLGKREKKSSDSELMQHKPASAGMWFGPRLGKRGKKSIDLDLIQQEPASLGMWFGPRLGKRGKKSSDSELMQPEPASISTWVGPWLGQREKKSNDNAEQVKQETASLGMWFGPRLGKRTMKSSDLEHLQQESAGAGMWFGPWLGHTEKKSNYNAKQVQHDTLSGGMWFGPRLGRREKKDNINDEHVKQEPGSGGMWFGPRLGHRMKSYDPEWFQKQKQLRTLLETMGDRPPEHDFTPQLDQDASTENDPIITNRSMSHNIPGISDDKEVMHGLSGRIWVVSQVGHKQKKMTRTITRVPQEVWTLLEKGNDKAPKHDFTPRLGRDLYENDITLFSKYLRLPQPRRDISKKYTDILYQDYGGIRHK